MNRKIPDLTITSVDYITLYNTAGEWKASLEEMQNVSISQEEETVDITGKQGRKLSTIKRNKAITVSGTNGLFSTGLYEMQAGSEFSEQETEVLWYDYLTVNSNAATTTYKAVGTSGAEIEDLFIKNSDGYIEDELEQAAEAATGKFAYDPDTKALTFSDIEDGTEIVVYYKRKLTASVLTNNSDSYSMKGIAYIDCTAEAPCTSKQYHVQIYIPKADFSGEIELTMGDDQTTHDFTLEALAGACGTAGELFTYTVFGVDTEDAA